MIKLSILNAGEALNEGQLSSVHLTFNRAVRTCKKLISVDLVDVVLFHNPEYVMLETGIGGSTPTTHIINIQLDAKRRLDKEVLYLAFCHEFHHAMRQRKFGFPKTLLDAVISEGLADQFEKEINLDAKLITYRKDISKKILLNGFSNLKKEMNSNSYDYFGWFFGTSKYPKYFGYTLGNMIVEKYLDHTNTTPSALVRTPAKSFIKYIGKTTL